MVSTLVQWLSDGRSSPVAEVAETRVAALRAQMSSAADDRGARHRYVAEWPEGGA